ncbi:hypothetical protein DTW90_36120 [Neorhizobium sp. P12A]|uniref:hypothetical protein n=1 Tax=Neorhizobium sp. P12A TaxID=2268027 RepID=UPI0011EBF093|nr:hypothetical protein [Neorhizobium sp. P12A]KAA0684568.1 hypothetical protein DTW90_36120 [Neorhizobium sp. P12A]
MSIDRIILKTIRLWSKFRAARLASISDRRLDRAIPGYLERKRKIENCRRSHRSTKSVLAEQREAMNAALRGGSR